MIHDVPQQFRFIGSLKRGGGMVAYTIGYARSLAIEPNLAAQLQSLNPLCDDVYVDEFAGSSKKIPSGLYRALLAAQPGDTFVVKRLVCLASSFKILEEVVQRLKADGIALRCLDENIDTSYGNMAPLDAMLQYLCSRRAFFRQATLSGLARARVDGRVGGRPKKLRDTDIQEARSLLADRRMTMAQLAKEMGVSRSSLYSAGLHKKIRPPSR